MKDYFHLSSCYSCELAFQNIFQSLGSSLLGLVVSKSHHLTHLQGYKQTSDVCIAFSIRVNNRHVRLDIHDTMQNLKPREDLKIIMTLDNSFASDEDIKEDYSETNLEHREASPSNDETTIDYVYESTAEQLHNLVLLLDQHAQQTNEQTVERYSGVAVDVVLLPATP